MPADGTSYALSWINAYPRRRGVPWRLSQGAVMHATDPFRRLYDANHARVHRLLVRIVGPQDADDLAQIVFAKAAKALPDFRGDAEGATWLYRIAANAASDWLRSRATNEAQLSVPLMPEEGGAHDALTDDDASTPEQQLAQKEMRECLRREIGRLPETLRGAFMLSALGGLTDAEIAETLGISRQAGKVRLHRARQAFRDLIAARCDFYRNELSCKPASPACCAQDKVAGTTP
jgi:RNA polymerase sigma-70 factor (ECF subfamily)